jgi:hypothetical protein
MFLITGSLRGRGKSKGSDKGKENDHIELILIAWAMARITKAIKRQEKGQGQGSYD